ncbi:lysophospholipase [Aspergillus heteromorphus CBS 117.55]|uniref:Lysophospholipase n=1 Tax=Aspergillus heteromorphus CBS 117.55 TaxID=1448321 RepID=A0A317WER3_9EURO|nr:lysophospholipase [Aspergillus heteromorphus CBS 117.55]PWY84769.1 lysophospholipase [Aspergillus heteromorphus CBS 117.55]
MRLLLLPAATAALSAALDLPQGYAPVPVSCPPDLEWIRPAVGLSRGEADWVQGRKKVVLGALDGYLARLGLTDFDVPEYISRLNQSGQAHVPILGMAISGGGFASAFTGTGAMRALDDRVDAANEQRTGGLLQSLTYLSGLSGGSWPTMSFSANNFPTAEEIVDIWKPEIDRFLTVENTTAEAATVDDMFEQIVTKDLEGFDIGVGDFMGRGYAYEFVPGASGGLNTTFSSIRNLSKFVSHEMPMPIIHLSEVGTGDPEYDGLYVPRSNGTIFDVTPFEFGAWDGSVRAFTPVEWLGNRLSHGRPVNESVCYQGFDRDSFIIGSSANAFNFWYLEAVSNNTLGQFAKRSLRQPGPSKRSIPLVDLDGIADVFEEAVGLNLTQIASSSYPNPFANLSLSSGNAHSSASLSMVDGSETGQTIPFWGQIQPARNVDFILAWDDSQDAAPYGWISGANLYNTYLAANATGLPFPIIPPVSTLVNLNYTTHPVLFGCGANLTTTGDTRAPLVLYYANAPYSAYTNFTFWQSSTTREQMDEIFVNSFDIVTQGNGTWDAEWADCIGCAVVERSLAHVGMQRTAQCEQCFSRYCWDGQLDESEPAEMNSNLILDPSVGFLEWNATNPF